MNDHKLNKIHIKNPFENEKSILLFYLFVISIINLIFSDAKWCMCESIRPKARLVYRSNILFSMENLIK